MTNNEILKADLLDLVFDNRNKQYGAYQLRRTYPQRLMLSVSIAAAIVSAVLWLAGLREVTQTVLATDPDPVVIRDYELPKPPEEPLQPKEPAAAPKAAEPVATAKLTSQIEIVRNDLIEKTDLPPVSELVDKAIGTKLVDGPAFNGGQQPAAIQPGSDGPASAAPAVENNTPVDFDRVEIMAEFPGGMDAFRRYIGNQLAGSESLEPGVKQTVSVRFVIGKDGWINEVVVLQSGGAVLDRSITRVLKKAPRWKPARQNGRDVAVIYTLPVTFVGGED